jgi:hypothetical protein
MQHTTQRRLLYLMGHTKAGRQSPVLMKARPSSLEPWFAKRQVPKESMWIR